MFGYICPDVPELKIKELERFRACYCGLCHELGSKYGVQARFILNYDFVFLAMLLWHENERSEYCFKRCLPAFCRKRCVSKSSRALSVCAGYSVILAYWRLCDSVDDDTGFKALRARLTRSLLRPSYKKAAAEFDEFDASVRRYLSELSKLQSSGEQSMDKSADKFALLLASASKSEADEKLRRALEQLLYHVGRIIYIADAYNDIKDDIKHGLYNPIAARFSIKTAEIPKEVSEEVLQTLCASQAMAASAYELLPKSYWSSITENIIYFGIPDMCQKVIAGTYQTNQRKLPKRPDRMPGRSEN